MTTSRLNELPQELQQEMRAKADASEELASGALEARQTGTAVLVADPLARRVLESASSQIELSLTHLDGDDLAQAEQDPQHLAAFELILADEPAAGRIRALFAAQETQAEAVNPAVVAIRHTARPAVDDPTSEARTAVQAASAESAFKLDPFDAVLTFPLQPSQVAAQLSLVLYAHRAFARRFRDALEELHLNRRIFRSVTSGISVANASLPDLPLVYVNPAFEVMTGYCLEEVQGKNCRFLQGPPGSPGHDQPAVTLLREAIRDRREVLTVLKNYRKNGTPFWNELSLSPILDRDGVTTHFVGIQTDVTARVEFEAALRESEKLAAVGRLASSIAHEINNPLESVMNLLYLAQRTEEDAESRRYVAAADKELQRVALITSQSLRFYKQSTRALAITARELLDSVLNLYEGRAENSNVRLERRDRSTHSIVCLESEIRQVLNNLVRNAIDAMHGRGGRLLIRTRDSVLRRGDDPPVPGVTITVADTGSGISPEVRRQLYKAFFTTKGIAGTGLGLWISSEIVTRHAGQLTLRSSEVPGRSGTVFQLFLPLQAPVA